jgi:hypothetical protein
MKKYLSLLLAFLFIQVPNELQASSIVLGEAPLLEPEYKLDLYLIPGDNAFKLIRNCEMQNDTLNQYWRPNRQQLEIIDKKLNVELEARKIIYSPKIIQKLYFGLADGLKNEKVYIFLYPALPDEIDINIGTDEFACLKVMTKVEFDIDSLTFKFLP